MATRHAAACVVLVAAWLAVAAAAAAEAPLSVPEGSVREIPTPFNSLRVSAFNIQVFGVSKMDEPEVVDILKQILIMYDICLIQEIRDASDTAIHELLAEVNSMGAGTWAMMLSIRLGRTSSMEQYAYFYKTETVSVVDDYQWPDDSDIFEREPYMVRFRASGYAVGEFSMMGIHVKPDDAVAEIDALYDVYESMVSRWGTENFLIAGDLNADCDYVGSGDWDNIRLWTDPRFQWTIGHDVDTTVSATHCAYDRLIVAGSALQGAYIGGSADIYNYETEMGISNELALDVSDHFPVEMLFD